MRKADSENKSGSHGWWAAVARVIHCPGTTVVFPIYDGHGNLVYTLSRAANDTFSLGNKRIYGVWGDLRYDGNPNAGPNTQYCANLGHKRDNESGLTYMRARYYEPWTGRFISEDPARDGWNWYVFCANDPVSRIDNSGKNSYWDAAAQVLILIGVLMMLAGSPEGFKAAAMWFVEGTKAFLFGVSLTTAIHYEIGGIFQVLKNAPRIVWGAMEGAIAYMQEVIAAARMSGIAAKAVLVYGGLGMIAYGVMLWAFF
jgi:RHS repeat-associated protein